MTEKIYYVNEKDIATGESAEKLSAHHADTKLHAAFSSYIFNKEGKFLVTQRAHSKKVWHGVWTNSCCGHPKPGETRENAVKRRLEYELGLKVKDLELVVTKYIYKTPPYSGIVEHEYCPIYVGVADSSLNINPDEVEDYKWVNWEWYKKQLENDSDDYSVFAIDVPKDSDLGHDNIPKWSWWAKDQISHLEKSESFNKFIEKFQV